MAKENTGVKAKKVKLDASDMIVTSESPLSYGYPVDGFRI